MSTDLAARLRAVVEERLTVARSAAASALPPWKYQILSFKYDGIAGALDETVMAFAHHAEPTIAVVNFIEANDPADAILACERDLWVLDQHERVEPGINCGCDLALCRCGEHVPWPCDDLVRLATRYRVEVDHD